MGRYDSSLNYVGEVLQNFIENFETVVLLKGLENQSDGLDWTFSVARN
jgi:hypothetical protein